VAFESAAQLMKALSRGAQCRGRGRRAGLLAAAAAVTALFLIWLSRLSMNGGKHSDAL
jgi:hypothetical protein